MRTTGWVRRGTAACPALVQARLLAGSGLRTSEACGLDRDQIDVDTGVLVVAESKFGKSRQVFLHEGAIVALRDYQRCRDRWCPAPAAPSFFVSTRGTRLDAHNITHTFAELVDAAGIQAPVGRRRPRLHDLRHSFTVATLLDWYREGGDVQARLPLLSTWLGHIDPKSTYWYLNSRELHQMGEKPQVARSTWQRNGICGQSVTAV
ncbi:MAG: tyrosine-type recombinase/integrase [Pseudonocardiales bacterium]|nr:tyrosine-type recombinase/integrase [Pseudonocardiales bacterium]